MVTLFALEFIYFIFFKFIFLPFSHTSPKNTEARASVCLNVATGLHIDRIEGSQSRYIKNKNDGCRGWKKVALG